MLMFDTFYHGMNSTINSVFGNMIHSFFQKCPSEFVSHKSNEPGQLCPQESGFLVKEKTALSLNIGARLWIRRNGVVKGTA